MKGGKKRGKERQRGREKIETETREWDNRKLRRLVSVRRKVRGRQKKVDGG